ncbi:protein argonaute 2 [Solanum dulcamara]|uniref:protein argonaute 2 n=1 Tax=Solanum dulcamara TaxID=45834 RepID=UPI0024860965|nr:protein argonaute 2 [Solanum dulcamara]
MDRGNYRRGGGDKAGRGGGYRDRGQGQGRSGGGGRGEAQIGSGRGGPQTGGGRGGPQMGSSNQPSFQHPQQWGNQPRPSGQYQFRGAPQNQPGQNPGGGGTWVNQPVQRGGGGPTWPRLPEQGSGVPSNAWARPPPQQPQQQGSGGGAASAWVRPPPQQHGGGSQQQQVVDRPPPPQSSDPVQVDLGSLKITEQSPSSPPESYKEKRVPVARPDTGKISVKSIGLLANHFPVRFNPQTTIMHYDVDIQQKAGENRPVKKLTNNAVLHMIREKLCADDPTRFPIDKTAYDGKKNIFSAVQLPTGCFTVNCSDGDDANGRSYGVTIKLVAELKLCKLKEYLSGNLSYIPRDILQGMDLVMKENPSRCRVSVGRSFYSNEHLAEHDFGFGVAAYRGFQQSLKPTTGGLALCLDYSVLALRKPMPVLDFLREYLGEPNEITFRKNIRAAKVALVGLKVRVIHRRTSQKFLIKQLTDCKTREITFPLEDPEGRDPPRDVFLVDYFRDKYQREIRFKDFPSLDIGKGNKKNYVPMEFCVLVEGQRYPKEDLDKDTALFLKNLSLARPQHRRETICEMVRAEDGPCGAVTRNFEIGVDMNMTRVSGRILPPPDLKLGGQSRLPVNDKCQWNLVGKSVVEGKALQRWALIDFSSQERNSFFRLRVDEFVFRLKDRCKKLSINMEEPVVKHFSNMNALSAVGKVEDLLNVVVDEARQKNKGKLQMIVCVMASKHNGYKYLKWVSETKIGVVTQCCLSSNANKGQDQYLANLCMKINAKLGGSNMELMERLPNFGSEDNVMFIGADVNHPAARNETCPSIAAVVATVNWPAANRYAARVCPQDHRTEKILNFGSMCADLVNTYARLNKVKPNRIVVFRDGVSEGQFDMVLNEELLDLAKAIYDSHYQPAITLVVAQKRHHTRLFPEGGPANVPPGTVVDTIIVHPTDFDFYLCSHFGGLGTSKPTHYHVLWDENGFNSDRLQKLIYNMCFTFARCTKPVSLVPPVYYADLVAYRGRMFQEVLMEMNSPRSTTSSYAASSSSSSSSPTASFEQRFYDLHPDLQNIMFFV